MAIRVAIDEFGRIGRLVYRAVVEQGLVGDEVEVVAVGDIVPTDNLAYLSKYDTTQGRFQGTVSPVDPNVMWTNRSLAELADELTAKKHPVDVKTVKRLMREELGLSRRQMVKTRAMGQSADRDAQFRHLQKLKAEFFSQGWPVLSIDTKKKELRRRNCWATSTDAVRLGRTDKCVPGTTTSPVRVWGR